MEGPQNFLKRSTILFNNSTTGYAPKRNESRVLKRYIHSRVYCSIINNSQDMETT